MCLWCCLFRFKAIAAVAKTKASSSMAIGLALSSYDWKSSFAEQKLASEDSEKPSLLLSDKLYPK